jgi:HK97 family phage portal protein
MWPFRKRTNDRALFNVGDIPVASTWAGVAVTPDGALRHSAVWGAVRLLADSVSMLPVDAYRDGSRQPVEPKPPILVTPAAFTPFHDFAYQAMASLLLRGNFYGRVAARDAVLRPSQIEPLHPDRVGVHLLADQVSVEYRLDGRKIDREDLLHVRAYTLPGCPAGLSPIQYAAQSVGLGLAAEKFGAQFFGDGAIPTGVLTSDQALTPTQATEIHSRWQSGAIGEVGSRYRRPLRSTAVLGNGARYQPIAVKPEESQFIETQKLNVAAIARIFGIPAEMLGGETGNSLTYSNTERRSIDFLTFTLSPWLNRLEVALSALLPRGTYAKFNAGALLRTDLKSRYESYEIALRNRFLTVNEVRELEDREPLAATPEPEAA